MKERQIHLFFKVLDEELKAQAEVILIGASAGSLMGNVRPSFDIDFEIRLKTDVAPDVKGKLEGAVLKASQIAGVATNYSENIGGWSRINYLDYRKTAKLYRKIGKLNIKIVAPAYWTIGKMARFLELDVQDMRKIIRAQKIEPNLLIRIWAKAVRASDLSLELGQFRDHVFYFLKTYGKSLWGSAFDSNKAILDFKKQARIEV